MAPNRAWTGLRRHCNRAIACVFPGSWIIDFLTIVPVLPFSFFTSITYRPAHHSILNLVYPMKVVRAYHALDRYVGNGMGSCS